MRWLKSVVLALALGAMLAAPAAAQWDWQAETSPKPTAGPRMDPGGNDGSSWSAAGSIIAFIFFSLTMAKLGAGSATEPPGDQ